jgi:hypothetical protein
MVMLQMHAVWVYLQARLGFTLVALSVLAQWHSSQYNASGFVFLSMAALSL